MKSDELTREEYMEIYEAFGEFVFIGDMRDFVTHITSAFRVHSSVKNYEDLNYSHVDIAYEESCERILLKFLHTILTIQTKRDSDISLPRWEDMTRHKLTDRQIAKLEVEEKQERAARLIGNSKSKAIHRQNLEKMFKVAQESGQGKEWADEAKRTYEAIDADLEAGIGYIEALLKPEGSGHGQG